MYVIKQKSGHGGSNTPHLAHYSAPGIALHTQEGTWLITWQEIRRCAADSNYTRVFLEDGTSLLVSKTLARLESILPSVHFVRIHQSHLVNIRSIRCFGREDVRLKCGLTLPVSRQGRKILKRAILFTTRQI